jgi:hypothetical protein
MPFAIWFIFFYPYTHIHIYTYTPLSQLYVTCITIIDTIILPIHTNDAYIHISIFFYPVGLIPPLQRAFFEEQGPLRPLGRCLKPIPI